MKQKSIPEERKITIRQNMLKHLKFGELSVSELSQSIGKSEKELYSHLEHLLNSKSIKIIPAECRICGYIFENRDRVKKPSKCPKCKGTYIVQPFFRITKP